MTDKRTDNDKMDCGWWVPFSQWPPDAQEKGYLVMYTQDWPKDAGPVPPTKTNPL